MLYIVFAVLAVQSPASPASVVTPQAERAPEVFHGFRGQTAAHAPRVEGSQVRIDGHLDEPVWSQAAILTGFSQYSPADGLPADDSTEVLVWYAPGSIYFGIRAFEAHG